MIGNRSRSVTQLVLTGVFFGVLIGAAQAQQDVRVWEEPLVIPTYRIGAPEKNPIFYGDRSYQGAQGAIYPYPMLDKLTDVREDRTYNAVYLENRYVKFCILPELGGRIFSGVDKTNQYDFIYHQHVIKPALIGMLGAWISGGVEWNIPHHHRASTFMPVDYTLEEHPDGSKTAWVGELEIRHRMKWLVGLTLYPDKAYLEATVKLINRTPYVHSFLYFANVAVHANENYQVIFPPSTEFATFHAKNEFLRWPLSDRDFGGLEFGREVDVSWWKNHPSPTSWFCFNCQEDFFGGYDHGKHAGIVHVADHHVVPGKKFWEWANGPEGFMWDKILTETDGPYIELMAGGYSDNQPDYSWIQPYEVKTLRQYWYPIRELGGIKNANLDAALNLEMTGGHAARIAVNATSEFAAARLVLKSGDREYFAQNVDVGPAKPFVKEVALPAGVQTDDLRLTLYSAAGKELISYTPTKQPQTPAPAVVKPPPPPKDIPTVEQLYLAGLRLDQFYNPAMSSYPYYEEALRRDPGNYRVNTQLGILYCQRMMYTEAEARLRTALASATHDYTSPREGDAFYYLGVALASQGKYDEAYDAFYKATWSWAWHAAGYFQLAQLDCRNGEFGKALEHLESSLSANAQNPEARDLKAAVLRHLKRHEEAAKEASTALVLDPLDFWAGNELLLAKSGLGQKDEAEKLRASLERRMRGESQSYLELATDYGHGGLWEEAINVLSRWDDAASAGRQNPMIYYFLAYFSEMKGQTAAAAKYYRLASDMPPDYCFPFRWEALDVLRHALAVNSRDAHAQYYLGNLLYDHQPENAIRAWEASRDFDPQYPTVHRNLGLAYARYQNDLPKAIASLEKAAQLDSDDATILYELDRLSERGRVAPEDRLARLEAHRQTILERDDATQQLAALYVELGRYDQALDLLAHRHFHVWEGGGDIHDVYVNAHLLRGRERFKNRQYRQALEDYQAALEYPENLEVGRPRRVPREAEIYYLIGSAYDALGDPTQARNAYKKSAAIKLEDSELRYFQVLALRRLGRETEASEMLRSLLKMGTEELASASAEASPTKLGEKRSVSARLAHAHYLLGLASLGQGQRQRAKEEFQRVLDQDMNHLGARTQLAEL